MSHFTHMKTRFQNLSYLKKALEKLNVLYVEPTTKTNNTNLTILQSNGYDLEFSWNGKEYEFIVDMSFWEQSYPIETFIDKVAQQYASEVIIGESQKTGFHPTNYQQNLDGSNTLILERWNNSN